MRLKAPLEPNYAHSRLHHKSALLLVHAWSAGGVGGRACCKIFPRTLSSKTDFCADRHVFYIRMSELQSEEVNRDLGLTAILILIEMPRFHNLHGHTSSSPHCSRADDWLIQQLAADMEVRQRRWVREQLSPLLMGAVC